MRLHTHMMQYYKQVGLYILYIRYIRIRVEKRICQDHKINNLRK